MIRLIHPIDNKSDFDKLTELLLKCLDCDDSFKFLSYSLIKFDKRTIDIQFHARADGMDLLKLRKYFYK